MGPAEPKSGSQSGFSLFHLIVVALLSLLIGAFVSRTGQQVPVQQVNETVDIGEPIVKSQQQEQPEQTEQTD